jgi:hypothetical protein
MIIKTESGSRYEIDDHRICKKFDSAGNVVDAFKVFFMKAVPTTVTQLGDVWNYPNGEPEVGMLLYIGGKDVSWLSTKVVSIDGGLNDK